MPGIESQLSSEAAQLRTRSRQGNANDDRASFTLKLEFHGLCCFAPADDGKSLRVFLPKVEEDEAAQVPEHKTVIKFPLDAVQGAAGAVDAEEGVEGIWAPVEEEIRFTFEGDTQEPALEIVGFNSTALGGFTPLQIDDNPGNDFNWVLSVGDSLRKMDREGARIRAALKERKLTSDDANLLGARIPLTLGRAGVGAFSEHDAKLVVWSIRPDDAENPDDGHEQLAATVVEVEMQVPAASVRLVARDLQDEEERVIVELSPTDASIPLVVKILNEESNAILGVGSQQGVVIGEIRGQDRIFRRVANLLEPEDGRDPFPVPIAKMLLDRRGGGVTKVAPPCSPVRVDG
jgi:hypothetical protein